MRRILVFASLAVAIAAQASPGAPGPNGARLEARAVAVPDKLARLPDGSVNLPVLAQRRLDIRTRLVEASEAAATVELPGRVLMDPNAGGRVQTLSGGRVVPGPRGLPIVGQAVRKGQVLGYVAFNASPIDAANQQAQLAGIRADRALADQRVRRLESLEGTVARKDIESARAALRSLEARERAVSASIGSREALTSPIDGVIASASVVAGQMAEPKDVLFEVIDPARVLVEATTVDASLWSSVGTASLAEVPGVSLAFLGASRSLRNGSLPLTFLASADAPLPLAVGQPVTVVASLKRKILGHVLPAQAVTRNAANEPVVWVKAGAERFVPVPVRIQQLDARTLVVTHGLDDGARVVVQGAPLVAQIR